MFLLTATLYWLGFTIPALAVARRSGALAIAVLLLALVPPAFMFLAKLLDRLRSERMSWPLEVSGRRSAL